MTWWLRGIGTSVSLVLDSRGHWKIFGRPSGVEDYSFQPATSSSPDLDERLRAARCAWQVSESLIDCPVGAEYQEAMVARSRRAAARAHAVTCVLSSPGQPDLLSFTIVVPPPLFREVMDQFRSALGRSDLRYSIFTPEATKLDVEPADTPAVREFWAGRPHFTAGVEFSFA